VSVHPKHELLPFTGKQREHFDAMVERAVKSLPGDLQSRIERVPVLVEDYPSSEVLESFAGDEEGPPELDELCGLHSGSGEAGIDDDGAVPNSITLYRLGIVAMAGGWGAGSAVMANDDAIYDEIVVTLLHELGHDFGLDEDGLTQLGYD